MRSALTIAIAGLALAACGSTAQPEAAAPAPSTSTTTTTASPTTTTTTPSPTTTTTVDNEALGRAMAASDKTNVALLTGVWKKTPTEKRRGTCDRWRNSPEDVYGVFSGMPRDTVRAFFDDACRAY